MATILIQRWQWGAPLEPLEDEAAFIRRDLAAKLSKLTDRREALRRLTIQSNVDSTTHVRATLLHPAHSLTFVLNEEMASYAYEPSKASGSTALATHLRAAAEPMIEAITGSTWFEPRVRQSQVYYDLEVQLDREPGVPGAIDCIVQQFAPPLAHPESTALAALSPVATASPHKLGLRTTCAAQAAGATFDLSIEIFGYRDKADSLRASVILLSPDNERPEEPWFSNAGALHAALWPAVKRFFDEVEAQHGDSETEDGKPGAAGRRQAVKRGAVKRR